MPTRTSGVKLTGLNKGVWCGSRCNHCLQKNHQIKVFFIEQDEGWNGPPDDAIDRITALAKHGLLKPETSTQQRRLEEFERRYLKSSEITKGGASR